MPYLAMHVRVCVSVCVCVCVETCMCERERDCMKLQHYMGLIFYRLNW